MERRAAEIKVLWSNLHRGIRTYYLTFTKPKESYFSYRLLASISKRFKELNELQDQSLHLYLKLFTPKMPSPSELSYSLVTLSLNFLGRIALRNRGYALFTAGIMGFKNPKLISASLTLNKDYYTEHIRPLLITLDPKAPDTFIKRKSPFILKKLWKVVISELTSLDRRYIELNYVGLQSPLAVISISSLQREIEEIKAVISDAGEYKEVKVPVRNPSWSLEDLPSKVIEDVKISIINPIHKGLPFAAKGALITGPPGVGKSVMAEALANALGLKVVELRPQIYRSMWYGTTEKTLNAIFKQIIKKRHHIALIIDDAEFISSRKYTIHEAHISEISTILYHLQKPERPFTILTANNPELIDPAILRPGRIDVTVVIGYPDKQMRRKAISRISSRYSIEFSSEEVIDKITDVTKWFTLAEIDAFLRLAASRGNSKIGINEVEWTKKKFNVNSSERSSLQEYLKWWARKTQGIVITYLPNNEEI